MGRKKPKKRRRVVAILDSDGYSEGSEEVEAYSLSSGENGWQSPDPVPARQKSPDPKDSLQVVFSHLPPTASGSTHAFESTMEATDNPSHSSLHPNSETRDRCRKSENESIAGALLDLQSPANVAGCCIEGMETATQVARETGFAVGRNDSKEDASSNALSAGSQISEDTTDGSAVSASDTAGATKKRSRLKMKRGRKTSPITDNKQDNAVIPSASVPVQGSHDGNINKESRAGSQTCGEKSSSTCETNTNKAASNTVVDLTPSDAPKQTPVKKKRKQAAQTLESKMTHNAANSSAFATLPQCREKKREPLGDEKIHGAKKPEGTFLKNPDGKVTEALSTTSGGKRSASPGGSTMEPPMPAKKKKRTYQDQVLHQMLIACKPFNMKTLSQTTRSTGAALHGVMLSLVDKDLVHKKEFASKKGGTTKVLYWANQESKCKEARDASATPEEIQQAREEKARLLRQESSIGSQMQLLVQHPTNADLGAQILQAEEDAKEINNRVHEVKMRIQASREQSLSARERCPLRMKMRINTMRSEWKTRKEKCNDFVDHMADAMEKKLKDVVKVLDIETDEMVGVKLPPKYSIGRR